jgi:hypothetical protein
MGSALARQLRTAFAASVLVTAFAACLSPTLPLPPPEAPESIRASTEEGIWEVRGDCTPGALVLVENHATGLISGIEDRDQDGRYLIRVAADRCDTAAVLEVIEDNTSAGTVFVVEPTTAGVPEGGCDG